MSPRTTQTLAGPAHPALRPEGSVRGGAGFRGRGGAGPALVGRLQPEVGRFGVRRRRLVTGEKEAYERVASPSLGSRGPSGKTQCPDPAAGPFP